MAEETEQCEVMADAAPPSYKSISSLPYRAQRHPGPATSGTFYHRDVQHCTMSMAFCPDPSQVPTNQDWAAVLMVKCCDIPRLMREGFHWDSSNIIKEEGYVDTDFSNAYRRSDGIWSGTRHYFLRDLQQPPLWIATIELFAPKTETLYRFDLNILSRENMRCTNAKSQSGHAIYCWAYGLPELSFNAIYGEMPMEGWWPWPRNN
ncbi:hypothetical protein F4782DRAFT_550539 [Xylaria castorea]|nr:hypothetical protein F4782DRAFT_550539 [Xylaria castorea]